MYVFNVLNFYFSFFLCSGTKNSNFLRFAIYVFDEKKCGDKMMQQIYRYFQLIRNIDTIYFQIIFVTFKYYYLYILRLFWGTTA